MGKKRLRIDADRHEVHMDGQEIKLTRRERDMLFMLASGKTITRPQFLSALWGSEHLDTRSVDQHVYTMREKLGPDSILSVRGLGYKIGKGFISK